MITGAMQARLLSLLLRQAPRLPLIPAVRPWFASPSCVQHRCQSTFSDATRKKIDSINDKFAEAREEIGMAMEVAGTTYFNEEAEEARKVAQDVLDRFDALQASLPDKERGELSRSMGLKMEQLKAELKMLRDAGMD
jgi:hypothetical protein